MTGKEFTGHLPPWLQCAGCGTLRHPDRLHTLSSGLRVCCFEDREFCLGVFANRRIEVLSEETRNSPVTP